LKFGKTPKLMSTSRGVIRDSSRQLFKSTGSPGAFSIDGGRGHLATSGYLLRGAHRSKCCAVLERRFEIAALHLQLLEQPTVENRRGYAQADGSSIGYCRCRATKKCCLHRSKMNHRRCAVPHLVEGKRKSLARAAARDDYPQRYPQEAVENNLLGSRGF
jgi:hypothetical protein